jgi:type VI secretion system secreted protein VgrG
MLCRCLSAAACAGLLFSTSIALIAGTRGPVLGCSRNFAILSGSEVLNRGGSRIYGDLGVKSGAALTGFPPGAVFDGIVYRGGDVVPDAQFDAFAAYHRLKRLPSSPIASAIEGNLGGRTFLPGVYSLDGSARVRGTLRLDAQGADDAVFVFQIGTTLLTAKNATVKILNRGRGDAVYWQVGSSAKLGEATSFEGSILAQKDITLEARASIRCGRAFTLTGPIALDRSSVSIACESPEGPSPGFGFVATGLYIHEGGAIPAPGTVNSSPEPGTFWLTLTCVAVWIAARFVCHIHHMNSKSAIHRTVSLRAIR